MRVTKAMLLERIKSMESFMRKDIQWTDDECAIRDAKGFVPVEQYAYQVPHPNEIGLIANGPRIFIEPIKKWEVKE